MSERLARRIVICLGLGLVLGVIVDDWALGFALGLALVFGLGMLTAKA